VETALTIRELTAILDPPVTIAQAATLTVLAGIEPCGHRRTRTPGRPAAVYDIAAVMRAHGEEARRTAKQFTDGDWVASALLARNLIRADTEAGAVWWPDGTRAEELVDGYGQVRAGHCRTPAHRIIWIAGDGEIPAGIQVNHINKLRWDNRRANLELVTFAENIRHGHGSPYLNYHDAMAGLAELPATADTPEYHGEQQYIRAGGAFRKAH
jgi:hypothetical protein